MLYLTANVMECDFISAILRVNQCCAGELSVIMVMFCIYADPCGYHQPRVAPEHLKGD